MYLGGAKPGDLVYFIENKHRCIYEITDISKIKNNIITLSTTGGKSYLDITVVFFGRFMYKLREDRD